MPMSPNRAPRMSCRAAKGSANQSAPHAGFSPVPTVRRGRGAGGRWQFCCIVSRNDPPVSGRVARRERLDGARESLGVLGQHRKFSRGLVPPRAVAQSGARCSAVPSVDVPADGRRALCAVAPVGGRDRAFRARRARQFLVIAPLAIAFISGAYPGWRAVTRPRTVDLTMRAIAGNGVALTWAPAGPGFNHLGLSCESARSTCARLTDDGLTLGATPLNIWRLPSVDEAVRTMIWRGRNAGGTWDPATRTPRFQSMPDKEAPLWDPFSPVIYWWTSDEIDADHAYRVVYNGQVTPLLKRISPAYLSCRCVRSTSQ